MMMRALAIIMLIPFVAAESCADGETCAAADHNVMIQLPAKIEQVDVQSHSEASLDEASESDEPPKPPVHHMDKDDTSVQHLHGTQKNLMKHMKRKTNGKGDLKAWISALTVNSIGFLTMCGIFMFLHKRCPIMFSNNILTGAAPTIPDTRFGWLEAAWNVSFEQLEKTAGLDAALLMEFTNMALKVALTLLVVMVPILCPVHYFWGEDPDEDNLSKVGMGNIVAKHGGWAYFLHAFLVWFVCIVTMQAIHQSQQKFMPKRYDWLLRMPAPRNSTVLVEGIPEQHCTDEGLRACFEKLFPDNNSGSRIKTAYMVRKTSALEGLVASYDAIQQSLDEANFKWQKDGAAEDDRPVHKASMLGAKVDSITYYEERKEEAAAAVIAERARLNDPANQSQVMATNGFVTFKTERDAKIALAMRVRADGDEFVLSTPPDPADILWSDLYMSDATLNALSFVGYAAIFGLFAGFMPIVLGISSLTDINNLRENIPAFDDFIKANPSMELTIKGILGSLALTLFMGFLPTFLNLIFAAFFQLKAGRWSQHRLQIYYFWFQVIFIILITAVGSSLLSTMAHLINHPTDIFQLLAEKLPCATHFYLNFMAMQWLVHGMNLIRYVQYAKFKIFGAIMEEDKAKQLAEPEDQDYYGMGARSARFTINLVICLVYCSLSPLICVVTTVNFVVCKIVYGYLLCYAETPKSDLGGAFFVTQLVHIQKGLFIYVCLMIGVLYYRAATHYPAAIVAPCLLYMARQHSRFQSMYEWESVPFEEFIDGQVRKASWPKGSIREATRDSYAQPELTEPILAGKK